MVVPAYPGHNNSANKVKPNLSCFLEIFKARKFVMGLFGGLIIGPEILGGFVKSLTDFFGF